MAKNYSVIAVGGGPAGLSLAIELKEQGMNLAEVLVLEKGPHPIEAIRRFYPEKKMTLANYKGLPTVTHGNLSVFPDLTKAETLVYYDELISKYEIPFRLNAEVSKIQKTDAGFLVRVGHEDYFANYVAIGIGILGRPNKPSYKLPSPLKSNLLFDLTSQEVKGMKVLVVGGGDTSSEYCQVLALDQNEICLSYRGEAFHRMMESNLRAVESLQAHKKLRVLLRTEIAEVQDAEGKPKVVFQNGEAEVFDKVVYAMGGSTPLNFLMSAGIKCENNWPLFDAAGRTNVEGLYLVGDLVAGKLGGSIITAYNSSFRTAADIVKLKKHDFRLSPASC